MEKSANPSACGFSQGLQSSLAKARWRRNFCGGLSASQMGFKARMSGSERASLFRLRPAHGTTDGQYMPQTELGLWTLRIRHRIAAKLVSPAP